MSVPLKENLLALEQLQRGQRELLEVTKAISRDESAGVVASYLQRCLHALTCLGREVAARHAQEIEWEQEDEAERDRIENERSLENEDELR